MRLTRALWIAALGMAVGMTPPAARAEQNITGVLASKKRAVLTAAGNPHVIGTGWLDITEGKEVVAGPGVEIRFVYDPRHSAPGFNTTGIHILKGGRLVMEGTVDRPVILTTGVDEMRTAGKPVEYWHGIVTEEGGSAAIDHAALRYSRSPAIRVRAGATASVRHARFELGGLGLHVEEGGNLTALESCRFRKGTTPVAWTTDNNVQVASCRGNVCDDGMRVDVGHFVRPGAYKLGAPGKAGSQTLPYYIPTTRGIEVGSKEGRVELTIEPGTVFMAQRSYSGGGTFYHSSIRVQHSASLQVMGDRAAPVRFTVEPDEKGKKAPGTWGGIIFEKSCGAAKSRIQLTILEYGASPVYPRSGNQYHAPGMIAVCGGNVTVLGCTLGYAGGAGLYVKEAQPDVSGCDFLYNQIGLDFEDVKLCRVVGCKMTGNKAFGARCNDCNGGKAAVDLSLNWWGDASGPLDGSDDRKTGGSHNPKGKGDKVSDYIKYAPWRTSPTGGTSPPPKDEPKVAITIDGPKEGGRYTAGGGITVKLFVKTPTDIKTYTTTLNGEEIAAARGPNPIPASRTDDLLCSFGIKVQPGKNVFVLKGTLVDGNPFTRTITFTGTKAATPPTPPTTSTPPTPPTAPTTATLLVDSFTAPPGETITVTISLAGAKLLRSMNWELLYDAKALQAVKVLQGDVLTTAGALFQDNARGAARIRFGFADKEGVRPGPLAHVEFRIIASAGSRSTLTLTNAKASGSDDRPVSLTLRNGSVTVEAKSLKGDDNGDGVVDVRDAMAALMMSVGNRKEDLVLDMDGSGKVEARDAELILSQIVGK